MTRVTDIPGGSRGARLTAIFCTMPQTELCRHRKVRRLPDYKEHELWTPQKVLLICSWEYVCGPRGCRRMSCCLIDGKRKLLLDSENGLSRIYRLLLRNGEAHVIFILARIVIEKRATKHDVRDTEASRPQNTHS
jgi:hypothetical protein